MTTLTDFLSARVAEEEAPTYELVPYDCEPGCCAPEGWVGHRCLICGGAASFGGTVAAIEEISREHEEGVHRRSRVLADCAAKRQILERHAYWFSLVPTDPGACLESKFAVQCLAAVYVDHPDYREEWKP